MHNTNKGQNTSYIQTSQRKISLTRRTISNIVGEPFQGRWKLDSNTDITVAVNNWAIIEYTNQGYDIAHFLEKYTPTKDIPIVSAATGFTLENGRSYILVFHEALYMPNMRHTLINPNQFRNFREKVQDHPYHEDCPISIDIPDGELSACLQYSGTVMFLYTWFPMQGNI